MGDKFHAKNLGAQQLLHNKIAKVFGNFFEVVKWQNLGSMNSHTAQQSDQLLNNPLRTCSLDTITQHIKLYTVSTSYGAFTNHFLSLSRCISVPFSS